MCIELCFASDGIVIGDRTKHVALAATFSDMFKIVHEFLNECYRKGILTDLGQFDFIRLKQGNGSPYPIVVTNETREFQLKYEDIKGIGGQESITPTDIQSGLA